MTTLTSPLTSAARPTGWSDLIGRLVRLSCRGNLAVKGIVDTYNVTPTGELKLYLRGATVSRRGAASAENTRWEQRMGQFQSRATDGNFYQFQNGTLRLLVSDSDR